MAQALRLAKVASYLGQVAVQMAGELVMVDLVQHGEAYCLTVPVEVYQALLAHVPVDPPQGQNTPAKRPAASSRGQRKNL